MALEKKKFEMNIIKGNKMEIISELQNKLGFNIYRVGLLFRRELIHALKDYQITPEQWQILMTLWESDKPINQNEIVKISLKDKHTVSRIIQRLERDEWIKKEGNSKDKRATMIIPTKKASSLQNEMKKKMSAHFKNIWKDFEKDEKNSLMDSLKKLRSVMGDSIT